MEIKHIDTSFYRLTATQAKALTIDGKLPKHGYEKRAKPVAELNQLVNRLVWRSGKWVALDRPISDGAQVWVKQTSVSWHDGQPVKDGWTWAIHIWEPV